MRAPALSALGTLERAWLTQGKRGHEGCAAQHLSEVEHLVQLLGRVRVLGHEGDAVLVPAPSLCSLGTQVYTPACAARDRDFEDFTL